MMGLHTLSSSYALRDGSEMPRTTRTISANDDRYSGLFRTEYTGKTLREHYGLPQPKGAFATSREA